MRTLMFLLRKEFLQMLRNRSILALIFLMPTVQLLILPQAANFDVKNIDLALLDQDHSSYSRELARKISASGYFRLVGASTSYPQALGLVEASQADIILEIPRHFERNLVREGTQQLGVAVDAINGTRAALGGAYLTRIISDFNGDVRLRWASAAPAGPPVTVEVAPLTWYNPLGRYYVFMVPAILVLLLTLVGGFLSALNIVREKELGTIEQLNVSPIRKWQFILGKLIPFWVLGMVVFSLGLLIARGVYGIVPVGSLGTLYLFAAVYLVAILGFGLLISTYSETQLQAMFVAFFFIMIFTLMSGLFTSLDSMPGWARVLANLIPLTHFIEVVRLIILKGSTLAEVSRQLGYEAIFAVVLNSWAIFNYRKTT